MEQNVHSEDLQDIIGSPPHRLIRWGITWILLLILMILLLSAFIRYPDVVQSTIQISTADAPKVIPARHSGHLAHILVQDGDNVRAGQQLAWIESTADHAQVLTLLDSLYLLRERLNADGHYLPVLNPAARTAHLGELQGSYQAFHAFYQNYQASRSGGIYQHRRLYILQDLEHVHGQRQQLESQRELQQQEYALAEQQFQRYSNLADKKVISTAEYQQQQAAFLAKKYPLHQTESALMTNDASRLAKQKELTDLDNQILEERSRFVQALHSLISEIEQWQLRYILTAPQAGQIVFSGNLQHNQYIESGRELFAINPGNTDYFGEISVPQYNLGKVSQGQRVLVKLHSYPFEQYGIIEGQINQFNHVPVRDSVFLSRVRLDMQRANPKIQLRTGLNGTAEIITEDRSLLARIYQNIVSALQ